MGLYLGSTDIEGASFYLGSSAVSQLYLGSTALIPASQVTANLQAYYDANNWSSGLWVDEVNSNDLTLNGPSSTGTDALGGKYFHFNDGSNSAYKTNMPDIGYGLDGGGNFTFEMLVQFQGSPAWDRLAAFWGSGNFVFTINSNSTSFTPVFDGFSSNFSVSGVSFSAGNWYHIISTFDSSNTQTLYINGSTIGSVNPTASPQTWPSSLSSGTGKTFAIGNYDSSNQGNFYMAMYRYYDKTLNGTEATQQMDYWSGLGLYTGL